MVYTVIVKKNGSQVGRPHPYRATNNGGWTLKKVVSKFKNDFLTGTEGDNFEDLDSDNKHIVELTRRQFDAGAQQYAAEFYSITPGKSERIPTGARYPFAAWSQPLAMATAKEQVPHHSPATGFTLLDQTHREVDASDQRYD